MKKIVVTCAVIMIASCQKSDLNENLEPRQDTTITSNYGVTVSNGRLKFENFSDFKKVVDMNREEEKKFIDYLKTLSEFKRHQTQTKSFSKNTTYCDCLIENDQFTNAIVDEHYMVDIEDWTIKFNACETPRKAYAFNHYGASITEISAMTASLVACQFDSPKFYQYNYEDDLLQELGISSDSIHGDPEAGQRRCPGYLASDRSDILDYYDDFQSPPPNYLSEHIFYPKIELVYDHGWFKGSTTVWFYTTTNPNSWPWRMEFDHTTYREHKCGDYHIRNEQSGILGDDFETRNGEVTWRFDEYFGGRLKAGEGNVKVRARHITWGYLTCYAQIVF